MRKLCVLLLPAILLAAGNLAPVTVLPQEPFNPSGAVEFATPTTPAGTDDPVLGTVDTIGGTTFDWQANGPSLRWLANSDGYGIHAVWMYSASTSGTTFPDRNMRYNFYDYSTSAWSFIDPDFMQSGVNTFAERSGFGGLNTDPTTGVAVVSRHYGTSTLSAGAARDAAPGAGIFEYSETPAGYLWSVLDVGSNGTIHASMMDDPGRQGLWYSKCATWPAWDSPENWATPTFPTQNVAASKTSQKVGVAWTVSDALGGQQYSYYRTSDDGGATWTPETQFDFPPAFGGDTVTTFHITAMFTYFDRLTDNFHVVACVNPIIHDTSYVLPAEIWHWSPANSPEWSEIHRANTASLAAAVGYNAMYACRPSIGEDRFGGLYVAWEQFDSTNAEPGPPARVRADIWYAQDNGDNGQTWQTGMKITTPNTTTKRFPSVIDYFPDDTLRIMYMVDLRAGFFLYSEGGATLNPVIMHKIPVTTGIGSGPEKPVTSVQLVAGPNPFSGRTELRYALPKAGNVKLQVFDLAGRPVATPVDGFKQAGRYSATFSARNMAPGVYVARLETNGRLITSKLVLTQ